MSDILAITTSHAQGWNAYGKRMAQSWLQHWPVPLMVYEDNFSVRDLPVADTFDLNSIGWLRKFKNYHPYRSATGRYDFKFDAPRFAHKTAAVIHAGMRHQGKWLIWCDADTVTHAPVPMSFVDSLLPIGDEYIAWLDRQRADGTPHYPECGFYVLNLQHPRHMDLMLEWRRLYTSAEVLKLPECHDSYVLQHLVITMGLKTKSLSGAGFRTGHPFINGPLGAYMDHMKGARKQRGRSTIADLRVRRTEPYWTPAT